MRYLLISIIILLAICLVIIFMKRKKQPINKNEVNTTNSTIINDVGFDPVQEDTPSISIEPVLSMMEIDNNELFEITDKKAIQSISAMIPHASEILSKTITNQAFKNAEIYKTIIPSGEKLTKSKNIPNAVRGYYHDSRGIKGQAQFVKVNSTNISKKASVAAGAATIINMASVVVGQYYMSEINSKLEMMNARIDKVSDFQDSEFKSKISSIIMEVQKISEFSSEILLSDNLRNQQMQVLNTLEREGIQLLQQVNISIKKIIGKDLPYKGYQETTMELAGLVKSQEILITLLEEISRLTYLLQKGEVSQEMAFSTFEKTLEESNQIRTILEKWHKNQLKLLSIDIDMNRRSKKGVEGFIVEVPSKFNPNFKYKALEDGLKERILDQILDYQLVSNDYGNVYENDVQMIIKEGKYYYLKNKEKT